MYDWERSVSAKSEISHVLYVFTQYRIREPNNTEQHTALSGERATGEGERERDGTKHTPAPVAGTKQKNVEVTVE